MSGHLCVRIGSRPGWSLVRFVTYNIRHAQGMDGIVSPRRIAETLAGLNADVIGLNEVFRLSGRRDQADIVAGFLGMSHEYAEAHAWGFMGAGNAVLTRGRILDTTRLELPRGLERREALVCTIELDGAVFRFATTHLSLGRAARESALERLMRDLPDDLPLVLSGDFNAARSALGAVSDRLTLADAQDTFPSVRPSRALDHVAHSREWKMTGSSTAKSWASDHLPLAVDLELDRG